MSRQHLYCKGWAIDNTHNIGKENNTLLVEVGLVGTHYMCGISVVGSPIKQTKFCQKCLFTKIIGQLVFPLGSTFVHETRVCEQGGALLELVSSTHMKEECVS